MREELIKEILRSKLLMGYDPSKTYSDNLNEQNPVWPKEVYMTDDQIKADQERQKKEKETEIANTYPNYCKPKENTYPYPEACGAILDNGIFLLKAPVGTPQEQVDVKVFCNYAMPTPNTPQGGLTSLLLPTGLSGLTDMNVKFVTEKTVQNMIRILWEKWGPNGKKLYSSQQDLEILAQNIATILPINTVSNFRLDNKLWMHVVEMNNDPGGGAYGKFVSPTDNYWYFKGYELQEGYTDDVRTGDYFQYVQCKDVRTPRQKFTDDWGWLIQWSTMIVTVVAGFFTGGGTWVLAAEILAEMSIAGFIAWREVEKGNNVEAGVSIVTGMAPWLKTFKAFRGVKAQSWDEISDLMKKNDYNGFKTADDYKKFYDDLTPTARQDWNIIARQDDLSRDFIFKNVTREFAENGEKIFWKDAQAWFKANPDKKWKIDFFRRLWVREVGTNLGIMGVGFLVQMFWGDKLDDECKDELNGLILDVPAEAQLEVLEVLAQVDEAYANRLMWRIKALTEEYNKNKEKQLEVIEAMAQKAEVSINKINKDAYDWVVKQRALKDAMREFGYVYQESPQDPYKLSNYESDPKKLEQDGYVKIDWESDWSQYPSEDLIWTPEGMWYKKPDESQLKKVGIDKIPDNPVLAKDPSKEPIKLPQTIKIEPNKDIKIQTPKNKVLKTPKYF